MSREGGLVYSVPRVINRVVVQDIIIISTRVGKLGVCGIQCGMRYTLPHMAVVSL